MSRKIIDRSWEQEFYKELGEFLVRYEQLMLWIKNGIIHLMWNFNNNMSYQHCIQILISELPSVQLIHKYFALFAYVFPEHKFLKKIEKCIDCSLSMNEVRNNIIHRRYLVWYYSDNETEFTKAHSANPQTRKTWLKYNFKKLGKEDIKIYNNYMADLDMLFQCMEVIDNKTVPKNFIEYNETKLDIMKKCLDDFCKKQ